MPRAKFCPNIFDLRGFRITNGTAVKVQGTWKKSLGKDQAKELHVRSVEILGSNDIDVSFISYA